MRNRVVISLMLGMLSFPVFAQNFLENISIGIVMPEPADCSNLSESMLARLSTKVERICTQNGLSSGYYPEGFVLYPVFELYEEDIIESDIQKIYSLKFEMSLFVRQLGGAIVSSTTQTYKGAGNSREKAILNAIASIKPEDPIYNKFIKTSKFKIIDYYRINTPRLIQKAESLSKQQQYEEAMAILVSIPSEVEQYPKVLDLSVKIYDNYVESESKSQILTAKGLIANRDYDGAISLLATVNPASTHYAEAVALVKNIDDKLTTEEKRDWNFKMQQYKDAVELEKKKIDADYAHRDRMMDSIISVAKAFCSNRPKIEYHLLR